jgi:hypothetical protein
MSLLIFELKNEHLLLLKNLRWGLTNDKFIISTEDLNDEPTLFNTNDIYEGIDIILNGKPKDFDPLNSFELVTYSDEQKKEWDKLISDLPVAVEIILSTQGFEVGKYVATHYDRVWKLTTNY